MEEVCLREILTHLLEVDIATCLSPIRFTLKKIKQKLNFK